VQGFDALAFREKTPRNFGIGSWEQGKADPALLEGLADWASKAGASGVVWTALGPRMNGEITSAFDVTQYLSTLREDTRRLAETRIQRTPRQVETPCRRGIEFHLGWTPEDS
jgi:hypothetical protein